MNPDKNIRILILFFFLTIVIHVAVILLCIAVPIVFLSLLLAWTPNITAILLLLLVIKEKNGVHKLVAGWKKWEAHPKWYLLALSPMFVYFISAGIYIILGGVSPGPTGNPYGLSIPVIVFLTIISGATGEELGWRGFALPRLQKRYNAVISSIILGFYWGIWHIPGWIFFNSPFTIESTFFFVLGTILNSIIITCVCNNTRGSVFFASVFHWSSNLWSHIVVSELGLISWEAVDWIKTPIYLLITIFLVLYYGPDKLSKDLSFESPDNIESTESMVTSKDS